MKKETVFVKAVFVLLLVSAVLFAGCSALTDLPVGNVNESASGERAALRNSDSVNGINNVIYTRSLDYIDHPDQYTHICLYAIKLSDEEGNLKTSDYLDRFSVSDVKNFKKDHPKVKVLLSLGGGDSTQTKYIYKAAKNNLDDFVDNLISLYKKYKDDNGNICVDGFDIDWEYFDSDQFESYTKYYYNFATKLKGKMSSDKLITMAAVADKEFLDNSSYGPKLVNYMDLVCVMSYWTDELSAMKDYYNAMTDKSKLAFGISYEKGSKTRSSSGQKVDTIIFSASDAKNHAKKILNGSYNNIKYTGIMAWCADADQDSTLQDAVYKAIKEYNAGSSNPPDNPPDNPPVTGNALSYTYTSKPTVLTSWSSSSSNSTGTVYAPSGVSVGYSTSTNALKIWSENKEFDVYIRYKGAPEKAALTFDASTSATVKITKMENCNNSQVVRNSLINSSRNIKSSRTAVEASNRTLEGNTEGWIHLHFSRSSSKNSNIYIYNLNMK